VASKAVSCICSSLAGSHHFCDLKLMLLRAGHAGPISQVCCDHRYDVALSASYDKTVRIWSTAGRDKGCLSGHAAPVLELRSNACGQAVSGDRSGHAMLWDLASGECTWALKNVHKGHITALAWADAAGGNEAWEGCFASGGQDGRLRLWDPRSHSNPAKLELHTNDAGKGALTGIVLGAHHVYALPSQLCVAFRTNLLRIPVRLGLKLGCASPMGLLGVCQLQAQDTGTVL
jgi:hypothetical protein